MKIIESERQNCKMRHKNGNCLPCGGFCTAVNNEICKALHNAYEHGYSDCKADTSHDKSFFAALSHAE